MVSGTQVMGGFILMGSILLLIGVVAGHIYTDYQYEKVIGSYMDNAKDMNTPDKMLEQLNFAKQGMINEGLTEDLYGAWIFTKPDNSMKFQYQHIDSIIERVKAVQQWQIKIYGNESNTQTENLGDVYETKMTNLRNFIMETTRSDWIAKDTWYVNKHFFYYMAIPIYLILLLLGFLGGFLITWEEF